MVPKIVFLLMIAFVLTLSGCASQNQLNTKSPQIDRVSEAELARIMPPPMAALSLDELVKLSKEGVAAELMIEKIKRTNSAYDLSPSQSIALHQQGVATKVLDYIHESRELAFRNNVADEINKRESNKRDALENLKREQLQQQRQYDPFCSYGAYGYYPYGYSPYPRHRLGLGAGIYRPFGCW